MSLEALSSAQSRAQEITGISRQETEEILVPTIYPLGKLSVDGEEYMAWRGYVGPEAWVGKGGIRMTTEFERTENNEPDLVKELPAEMAGKLALWGLAYKGAKGIIEANPHVLDLKTRRELVKQFAERMTENGLAGYNVDVPAGDMGTNGLADTYALRYKELKPEDEFWQGSVTGKSPEIGGLEFRPAATGFGVYQALAYEINRMGRDEVQTVKVQGFGNVGSHFSRFASEGWNTKVVAVSDIDGTLYSPQGLFITPEIVNQIGDNPAYRGNKLLDLAEALQANRSDLELHYTPDRNHINDVEADWYIPASIPNAITAANVQHINTRHGVIEAGNGVTTHDAHKYLVENGKIVVPDLAANGAGVACSIHELRLNTSFFANSTIETDNNSVINGLTQASQSVMRRMHRVAEALDTHDLRVAAAVIQIAQLATWHGVQVDSRIKNYLVPTE